MSEFGTRVADGVVVESAPLVGRRSVEGMLKWKHSTSLASKFPLVHTSSPPNGPKTLRRREPDSVIGITQKV